jgi:hypothetical protein
MVIDNSQNKNLKSVGIETIPAEKTFKIIKNLEEVGGRDYKSQPANADQQTCRRISALLPKTGLGKGADDFGLMENAARQHNNYNGSLGNLEMSVNVSKSLKSNHISPIRHFRTSKLLLECAKSDSGNTCLIMVLPKRDSGSPEMTLGSPKIILGDPERILGKPEMVRDIPKSFRDIPKGTRDIPNITNDILISPVCAVFQCIGKFLILHVQKLITFRLIPN